MKMKQITAATIQEALKLARTELGEDAVLLDQKKAVGGKGITVTFAVDEADALSFDDVMPEYPESVVPFVAPHIQRATTAKVEIDHPAAAMVLEALEHHHLPASLQDRLRMRLRSVQFRAGGLHDVAESALADILSQILSFKSISTAANIPPARALMLIGMHGAGKTSAIAKLATELTLHKQRVVLISCDNERLGGTDTLASLSELLKCGFHVAEDRAVLKALLKDYQGQAWILIDSPGVNIYEFQQLKALGELASLHGVEPILTCPAGMDAEEATEMAAVLGFLAPERMIVTKVDAARRLSSVFAALGNSELALANISSSAKPTEVCSPASAAGLARIMLRPLRDHATH